jgi:hypothetical protein
MCSPSSAGCRLNNINFVHALPISSRGARQQWPVADQRKEKLVS